MSQITCDFEGVASGTTCTPANLLAATQGAGGSAEWTIGGSGADMKFESAAAHDGLLGVQYDTDTVQSWIGFHPWGEFNESPSASCSAGIWFWTDLPDIDTSVLDIFTIFTIGSGNFSNIIHSVANSGLIRNFELEGNNADAVESPTGQWYFISVLYEEVGTQRMRIYNAASAQIGSEVTTASSGSGKPSRILIGQSISGGITGGFVCNFDTLIVDDTGIWPLLPPATDVLEVTNLNATTLTVG